MDEYIPQAHVKYLEQAGIKVVPVSFKKPKSELYHMLDMLNGLYIHGDSQRSYQNDEFQQTITNVLLYVREKLKDHEVNFPVFFMGSSIHHFLHYYLRTE